MKALLYTFLVLSVILLFGAGSATYAQQLSTEQTAVELPSMDSPEAVRALVSRLSDREVRALLLQQLDAVAAREVTEDAADETGLFTLITTSVPISIQLAVSVFPNMISGQIEIFRVFIDSLGPNGFLKLLGGFVLAIIAGLMVELLVRRFTLKWRSANEGSSSSDHSLKQILKLLSLRFVLDLSGLLAFMIVTQLVLRQVMDPKVHFS